VQKAAQELSGLDIYAREIRTQLGLAEGNCYISKFITITGEDIVEHKVPCVAMRKGLLANSYGFLKPRAEQAKAIGLHILNDWLELKGHNVTYPMLGHVGLAPFSSIIRKEFKKGKPALHLIGQSGQGKTFLATAMMAFFGEIREEWSTWTSTPNVIEGEGDHSRG
jgi:hypothetical protein